jgi:hypothetical protein
MDGQAKEDLESILRVIGTLLPTRRYLAHAVILWDPIPDALALRKSSDQPSDETTRLRMQKPNEVLKAASAASRAGEALLTLVNRVPNA